ncbi:MAG: hypothetical protein ABUT20_44415, partial [Bacteroidota bacterium]
MKLHVALLSAFTIVLFTSCKKDFTTPTVASVKGYAKFTDIGNGKPFKNLAVDLVSCAETNLLGSCVRFDRLFRKYTDSTGSFEYDQAGANGFACEPPGFFPVLQNGVAKFDYDGTTSHVQLVPKAYLNIDISPASVYP